MKHIGWIPVCVGGMGTGKLLGPWIEEVSSTKKFCKGRMEYRYPGVRFKFAKVYIEDEGKK